METSTFAFEDRQQWDKLRRARQEAHARLIQTGVNSDSLPARAQCVRDSTIRLRAWEREFCDKGGFKAVRLLQLWQGDGKQKKGDDSRIQEQPVRDNHAEQSHARSETGYEQASKTDDGHGNIKSPKPSWQSLHWSPWTEIQFDLPRIARGLLVTLLAVWMWSVCRLVPVQPGFWQEATLNATNVFQHDIPMAKGAIHSRAFAICHLDHARSLLSPRLVTPDYRYMRHRTPLRQSASGHCARDDPGLGQHHPSSISLSLPLSRHAFQRLPIDLDTLEVTLQDLSFLSQAYHGRVVTYFSFLLRGRNTTLPPPECGVFRVPCILYNWVRPTWIGNFIPHWTHSEIRVQKAITAHIQGFEALDTIAGLEINLQDRTEQCLNLTSKIWNTIHTHFDDTDAAEPITAKQIRNLLDFIFTFVLPNSCLGVHTRLTPAEYHLIRPVPPAYSRPTVDSIHLTHAFAHQISSLQTYGMWTEENLLQIPSETTVQTAREIQRELRKVMESFGNWANVLLEERRKDEWTMMTGEGVGIEADGGHM